MVRIVFRFLAGRLHATPWGRHVNEGDIEWPPSPWRLCRALIASGFAHLGWTDIPLDMHGLITSLCAVAPVYYLPAISQGHTRHYMPQFKGSTAKVIDAFAYLGHDADAVLVVDWQVQLTASQKTLLQALLETLAYLGRAESWVEAQLTEGHLDIPPAGLSRCVALDAPPGPDATAYERIALLAPMSADDYTTWRQEAVVIEQGQRLAEEQQRAMNRGKKPPQSLSKKAIQEMDMGFPKDIVQALLIDTDTLQRQGFSQPPGSRWISYWRDRMIMTLTEHAKAVPSTLVKPTTALLAIASESKNREVLPSLHDALLRMDVLHEALVKRSDSGDGPSPCLVGKHWDGALMQGHQHAMLLPLWLDDAHRGKIDSILVHAPMGLDTKANQALSGLRKAYAKNLPDLYVTLVGLGQLSDFVSLLQRHLGPSHCWTSLTPFVPPRYLKAKGNNSLVGQVQAELASRGLPPARTIQVQVEPHDYVDEAEFWPIWSRQRADVAVASGEGQRDGLAAPLRMLATEWRHFRRERLDRAKRPPVSAGFGLRLTFDEPVAGPIALGYASHFGLGQFVHGK